MTFAKAKSIATSVIEFFKTPLGQIIGVLILAFALFIAGHHYGKKKVYAEWNLANAQIEVARVQRDVEIAIKLDAVAAKATATQKKLEDALTKKVADYEAELEQRRAKDEDQCHDKKGKPVHRFRLDDRDAKWLQRIQ